MSETHFLIHDDGDSVGVVVVETVKAGMEVCGYTMDTHEKVTMTAQNDIPLGHKIALGDMDIGDTVMKYGVDMGKVVEAIPQGGHGG